jgi:hypothetical protein
MSTERPKAGWLATWREKQRLKRERTGDTREKAAEGHRSPSEPTVKDAAAKLPAGGGLIGGGPVGM